MEPVSTALLLSSIVNMLGTGVGAGVNASEMGRAKEEAMALDARNFGETQKMNRFGMDMSKANLAMSQEGLNLQKDRFGLEKMTTGYGLIKDKANRVAQMLNTNVGLQNLVLNKWGAK